MVQEVARKLLLEEWKERNSYYRDLTGRCLTAISVFAVGYFLVLSAAISIEGLADVARGLILGISLFAMVLLPFGHRIFYREATRLGERINHLESCLGIEVFDTTSLLKRVIWLSFSIGSCIFLGNIVLLIYVLLVGVG